MVKNLAIIALFFLVLAEGAYILKLRHQRTEIRQAVMATTQAPAASPTPARRPPPMTPGSKFSDNPLSRNAYQIYPGPISDAAQKVMSGWTLKTTKLNGGNTQLNLIPSETEDIQQEFIAKPGWSLYFIEMNLNDDQNGHDLNRGDDLGVLVDQNGVVQ